MENEKKSTGMATASLVLGIIAAVVGLLPLISGWFLMVSWMAWILALLAIIFGIIALCKKQSVAKPVIGIILGLLGCAAPYIFKGVFEDRANEMVDGVYDMLEESGADQQTLDNLDALRNK